MTREEAEAHISARFNRIGAETLLERRCYIAWTETWRSKDGSDATPEDVEAFKAVPRGQGHSVKVSGAVVVLRCELDSGD